MSIILSYLLTTTISFEGIFFLNSKFYTNFQQPKAFFPEVNKFINNKILIF